MLNSSFVSAANNSIGNTLVLGGAVTTLDFSSIPEQVFANSSTSGSPLPQLVLVTDAPDAGPIATPLPAAAWGGLALFGMIGGKGLLARRRKPTAAA